MILNLILGCPRDLSGNIVDDREKKAKTGKVRQGVMAQGRTPTKSCSQEMRNCGRN